MSAYVIEVTCPRCEPATELEPVVEGITCSTYSTAVARCPVCRFTFQIMCFLRVAGTGDGAERQRRSRRNRSRAA